MLSDPCLRGPWYGWPPGVLHSHPREPWASGVIRAPQIWSTLPERPSKPPKVWSNSSRMIEAIRLACGRERPQDTQYVWRVGLPWQGFGRALAPWRYPDVAETASSSQTHVGMTPNRRYRILPVELVV